ncbi:MAG: hydrogen-dependent growth transcriptional repressor [Desulfuromonas sp.]|nr:MAG: hydrogen-dependent growth transcriptional repressor [Desulfuromonas sp.]
MGKSVENPKRYIVSCRVSEDEMTHLQDLARTQGVSLTALLRQALPLATEKAA